MQQKFVDRGNQKIYYRAFELKAGETRYTIMDAHVGQYMAEVGDMCENGEIDWVYVGDDCPSFRDPVLAERRAHARAWHLAGLTQAFSA